MSDAKIAVCEQEDDGNVFVKFGDKMTNISDSEIFFVLSYNDKKKDSMFVTSNVNKDTLNLFLAMIEDSVNKLIKSLDVTIYLTSDTKLCESVFKGHVIDK